MADRAFQHSLRRFGVTVTAAATTTTATGPAAASASSRGDGAPDAAKSSSDR